MSSEAIQILKGRFKVAAGQKVTSHFWVADGFASIKGIVNASAVGTASRVRLIQAVDPQKFDRDRRIALLDPQSDVRVVEPVVATLVRVDIENGAAVEAEISADLSIRRERIERGEIKFRDFYHDTVAIGAASDFPDNVVNLQETLGRSVTSLRLVPGAAGLLVKINDSTTDEFTIPSPGGREFTPDVDQLEICRIYIKNPTIGIINLEIFAT